jgi:hypothetical protein
LNKYYARGLRPVAAAFHAKKDDPDRFKREAQSCGALSCSAAMGTDFTDRFPSIAQLLRELSASAAVIDGEVVDSDTDGRPNFARLHVRWTRPGVSICGPFDSLALNGQDWRQQPLMKR